MSDLHEVIRKLEHAQNLLWRNETNAAKTAIYGAEQLVRFIKDHRLS